MVFGSPPYAGIGLGLGGLANAAYGQQPQTPFLGAGAWLGAAHNQETQLLVSDKQTQVQRELNILDGKIIDVLCQVYDRNLIVALLDLRTQVEITQNVNLTPIPPEPEPVIKQSHAIKYKKTKDGGKTFPSNHAIHIVEYEEGRLPKQRKSRALCGTKPADEWEFLSRERGEIQEEFTGDTGELFGYNVNLRQTESALINPGYVYHKQFLACAECHKKLDIIPAPANAEDQDASRDYELIKQARRARQNAEREEAETKLCEELDALYDAELDEGEF